MAGAPGEGFAGIVALAHTSLTDVEIEQDVSFDRAILTIRGHYGHYKVFIKETVGVALRRYAFYVLLDNRVMLGLDNHADRQALRLKYDDDFKAHIHELLPHRHGIDKMTTALTEEWTAEQFLDTLEHLVNEIADSKAGRT